MGKISKEKLSEQIDGWKEKVLNSYEADKPSSGYMIDIYRMIRDIDKIIADAFDVETVISQ